ncbi:hypothetical protein HK104_000247 [Borealophlyctis nickersoniae]|nr:hypothetical protein HK104_000247 [Borealophlyctis nickersoniae]
MPRELTLDAMGEEVDYMIDPNPPWDHPVSYMLGNGREENWEEGDFPVYLGGHPNRCWGPERNYLPRCGLANIPFRLLFEMPYTPRFDESARKVAGGKQFYNLRVWQCPMPGHEREVECMVVVTHRSLKFETW